ncbi:MAG: ATP-binding protein [Roseovarius sp.]
MVATSDIGVDRVSTYLRPRGKAVMGAALLFMAAGVVLAHDAARLTFLLTGLMLASIAVWLWSSARRRDRTALADIRLVMRVSAHDPTPTFLTGPDRLLLYVNHAADEAFGARAETTLAAALGSVFAGSGSLLMQLEAEAQAQGACLRSIEGAEGTHRITVNAIGRGRFLWRVDWQARPTGEPGPDMPVPAFCLDADDTVLACNAAARDLLGANVASLALFCPGRRIKPGQINDIHSPDGVLACLALECPRDDDKRDVYLFPSMQPVGNSPQGWTFFDSLPVPLLKLSTDGMILLSNLPARDVLGLDAVEGCRFAEIMEGPGRPLVDWVGDVAAGRLPAGTETLRVRRDDREIYVQVTLNAMADNGRTVIIAVLNDATRLKTLEAQFAQSQKMQAIGQLAGGVAHDFNNLLTAISGHCDLLLLRHDRSDAEYPDLVQISQNANRAAALVSQLLAYSRKQTLRLEVMDMRDVLSDITHLLNRLVGERVSLSVRHEPGLWSVRADKRQIEQVIMNLVVNSRDAMPEGGEIRITTENIRLAEPMLRDQVEVPEGRYVKVRVVDEGFGIPPDKLQKVFEPFFTTKKTGEGTGLGLSTVYGIVKQTGGFIFVDSALGEGAEFCLMLPAHDSVAQQVKAPVAPPARERSTEGVVLLVEDEAPVRAFASRALKMRGLSVLEAASAEEALEMLADPSLKVDVFVTDVIMPGMDGPSWVRKALQSRPETRVVFVSGYAPETFGDTKRDIPNSMFLPKPFSLTELTETVQAQLSQ